MNEINFIDNEIDVHLNKNQYRIVVNEGLIATAAKHINPLLHEPRVIIVSDKNVAKNWMLLLEESFKKESIEVCKIILEPGEGTKSFAQLEYLTKSVLSLGITRKTTLVALGGGVIGDITGFAASILLRGIGFVQIPTTLLAQVDSSVGGKTAINSCYGKNLIGSFHQPLLVLSDTNSLRSLSKRQLLAGYSELVKHGLIGSHSFFEWCERNSKKILAGDSATLKSAVLESCRIKSQIVERDETENGERALLNLGHTFAHAFEAEAKYSEQLLHGEAVAVGIILAFELSQYLGYCSMQEVIRVREHFMDVGLPTKISDISNELWHPNDLITHMQRDKKTHSGRIVFILVNKIGKPFVSKDVKLDDIKKFLVSTLN